jgi:shikimate 5-dehydrogenase
MLVYQGAASFKLQTGKEAPVDLMFSEAKKILTGGKG